MQAIFFDACGVLYYRPRRYLHLLAFLQRHQLPTPTPAELQRLRSEVKPQGQPAASRAAKYDAFLTVLGVRDPAQRDEGRRVLANEAAAIALFPGVAATLRTLKARGFKLGVITNTATPGAEKRRWLADAGIDVWFDSFVASCEVGAAKPQPRIYQLALDECGVAAEAALFVGHEPAELAGARRVGMRTAAFAGGAEAAQVADDAITAFAELLELPCLKARSALLETTRDAWR